MLKTFKVNIDGYGTIAQLNGEKAAVGQVWLNTDKGSSVKLTLIADGYKELLCDVTANGDPVKLPVIYRAKTKNLVAIVKTDEPINDTLNITVDYV